MEEGNEGRDCQGGEETLNWADRSSEKKSVERDVSERIPPRK